MSGNRTKTIGVIGGMGPMATVDLYRKIIQLTAATVDEEHLNVQIDGNPVPGANCVPLCERAKRLEQWGVDVIAIPCNTAHIHHAAVQASVRIPVLNMIHEAVQTALQLDPPVQRVGVMGWHETLTAGIYQRELEASGLIPVVPTEAERETINRLVEAVKRGDILEAIRRDAIQTGMVLTQRGAQAIILGCTELPLALSRADFPVPVIDATLALAKAAVQYATS